MVLQRVEVARLGAEAERDLRHLAGRIRMVRRELATLSASRVAAAAGSEHDGAGVDDVVADARTPAAVRLPELAQRRVREARPAAGLPRFAQLLRDRVARAVADLEQALRGRAAAAGEPVAAVLARELDAELLEPVDRGVGLARQHLDETQVGGLVRGAPDVVGVLLGRVVVAEGSLDAALGLRGVVRLQRAFRRECDARARALGRDGGREARGAAADHEHVECLGRALHGEDHT